MVQQVGGRRYGRRPGLLRGPYKYPGKNRISLRTPVRPRWNNRAMFETTPPQPLPGSIDPAELADPVAAVIAAEVTGRTSQPDEAA